jgi:hypothetical protein
VGGLFTILIGAALLGGGVLMATSPGEYLAAVRCDYKVDRYRCVLDYESQGGGWQESMPAVVGAKHGVVHDFPDDLVIRLRGGEERKLTIGGYDETAVLAQTLDDAVKSKRAWSHVFEPPNPKKPWALAAIGALLVLIGLWQLVDHFRPRKRTR